MARVHRASYARPSRRRVGGLAQAIRLVDNRICPTGMFAGTAGPAHLAGGPAAGEVNMALIPLSPIDQIFTGVGSYPIEFVFAYGDVMDEDGLRGALDDTVARFPPVRSKLVKLTDDTYGLEPSEDGLCFSAAESDESFEGLENAHRFLDPVRTEEGEPLTRVKLTRTPTGSVLGVSMSHAVADGFGYFFFLSNWAGAFRGESRPAPVHRRELLIPEVGDPAETITAADVLRDSGIHWAGRRSEVRRDEMSWERQAISREEARDLVGQARESSDGSVSFNDVIAARLWRDTVTRWPSNEGEVETMLACPVDFRRTLASLPPTYFGCAVCLATAVLDVDSLTGASLGQLASRTRSAVRTVNAERVWKGLRTLEAVRRQEGLGMLERAHVVPPNGLLVTNLSRLPVEQIGFDAGPPSGFEILTPAERSAVILPADGGFEVRICRPRADRD